MKIISSPFLALAILSGSSSVLAEQSKRPFTLADEIGLTLFDAQGFVYPPAIHFSPDADLPRKIIQLNLATGASQIAATMPAMSDFDLSDVRNTKAGTINQAHLAICPDCEQIYREYLIVSNEAIPALAGDYPVSEDEVLWDGSKTENRPFAAIRQHQARFVSRNALFSGRWQSASFVAARVRNR